MKRTFLCCLATVSLMAYAEQTIKVTVENPTKDVRMDAPVVIQLANLGIDVRSAMVIDGEKEIPCQLDDLNADKRFDELCFTTDLGKREKKTFEVTLYDKGKPRQYDSRVFIEMVLRNYQGKAKNQHDFYISELTVDRGVDSYRIQHHHGIAFESELTAYRIYFDQRQSPDLYGKRHKRLELRETQFYPDDDQLANGYGDDVLWCGQTFALGAFRGWDGQKSVTLDDAEHLSQRIIARGPVRVIAEMVCDEWNAPTSTPNAKPITLRQRFTQWAGHRDVQVEEKFSRPVADYEFSTGISNVKGSEEFSDKKGLRGCWGTDYPAADTTKWSRETVGLGILIPQENIVSEEAANKDNYAYVVKVNGKHMAYKVSYTSDKESFGYHKAEDWFNHLSAWKKEVEEPVVITIK